MLVDTHCHLTSERFDDDRDEVIAAARESGVKWMIAIGSGFGIAQNEAAIALAHQHADIKATAGCHPQEADRWRPEDAATLRTWLQDEQVVAIGECGLDYAYDYAAFKDQQLPVFERQCELALEHQLPLVVHTRDAFDDTVAILKSAGIGKIVPGVIHFFTGSRQEAEVYLDMGLDISIPGVVTLPNAPDLVAAVPHLPLDRLMIETDSPYAAPVPKRGRRNQPAYVVYVAEKLAELRGCSVDEVIKKTGEKAQAFFGLEA